MRDDHLNTSGTELRTASTVSNILLENDLCADSNRTEIIQSMSCFNSAVVRW